MVDDIEIEADEEDGSELVDAFDDNRNLLDGDFDGILSELKNDRLNTDISSTDENSNEPSQVLLQNRLK